MKIMNRYVSSKTFLIISLFLVLIESLLIYLVIKSFLTKDFVSREEITLYKYLQIKLSNIL